MILCLANRPYIQIGTLKFQCVSSNIGDKRFIFLDTPGFGHPDLKSKHVKKIIYATLGYFTRQLGGIHGIFYLQSIMSPRIEQGNRECMDFLTSLCKNSAEKLDPNLRRRVTFITTNWDLVPEQPAKRVKFETKVREFQTTEWREFRIGSSDGARSFTCGCDSTEDDQIVQEAARADIITRVLEWYNDQKQRGLTMPFSQWTWGKQAEAIFIVVTAPVWVPVYAISQVLSQISWGISVEVRF